MATCCSSMCIGILFCSRSLTSLGWRDVRAILVIVSLLFAAQLSGTEVEIRFNGCNGQNQGKIVGVYLK